MHLAREERSGRGNENGRAIGLAWLGRARCGNRRRVGSRTVARIICVGMGRQWQRGRLCSHPGAARQPGWSPPVLAARGDSRAAGLPSCAGIGRNRDQSGATDPGRAARCGDIAARGSRCHSLCRRRRCRDRIVAQSPRARPDGEQATDACGGNFGRHRAASARRGGTRPQRRANALEHSRRAFYRNGGWGTWTSCVRRSIAAPARSPGWRVLASGMGS